MFKITRPEDEPVHLAEGPGRLRGERVHASGMMLGMASSGMVLDIQRFCTHDGPGIRTVVFLKGCPLCCPWCHNPESQRFEAELRYAEHLCVHCGRCVKACPSQAQQIVDGRHVYHREHCRRCMQCATACTANALEAVGRRMEVDAVLDEVLRDKVFYDESGGGLTLSGGEPMAQFAFSRDLLQDARQAGLHTCVETSGAGPQQGWTELAGLVDLFLWDIKHTDAQSVHELTGGSLEQMLSHLHEIDAAGTASRLRCVLIAGVNLDRGHLDGVAGIYRSLQHCRGVDLLAFHRLGEAKRHLIGTVANDHPEWVPTPEMMQDALAYLTEDCGIPVSMALA